MSSRCPDCGRFAGRGHTCPTGPELPTCQRDGCEEDCPGTDRKFCSKDCYDEQRRIDREARRPVCALEGCENKIARDAKKYCSQACAADAKTGQVHSEATVRPCAVCGTETTNDKFCSTGCMHEAKRTPSEVEVDVGASQESYFIAEDQVVFAMDNKMFRVPVYRWEAICKDYSEYGGDLTQAEVARKHGIPQPMVRRALRAYDQYKASPPMMRERIAEAEQLEPLVQEAVENKEYQLLQRIERREERKIKREWREMKERLQDEERWMDAAERVAERMSVPEAPEVVIPDTSRWGDVLAITTDEHLGLPVWGDGSWGENYDTDIAARRIVGQGVRGAEWVAAQGGAETVYRPYAGDLFNAIFGSTTHDTPMDQDTRDERVWDMAIQAVLRNAQAWRQVCERLVILFVSGNHDGPKVYQFASTMRFALEDADDVKVRATPKKYDAVRVGEALHVFDHGANLSKLSGYKAIADAETVARKAGGEDYHGAEYIGYHVGHRHDRMVVTQGDHMELIRHPALCESSEYEHENRWVATPCADIMLLDDRGRIDTPKRLYRDQLDAAGAA